MGEHTTYEIIDSDVTVNFTAAAAQDVNLDEDIVMPDSFLKNVINKVEIKEISIQSKQNLEWDLILWSKSSKASTTLNSDSYIISINFPVGSGKQIAGANQWYYNAPLNIKLDYVDADSPSASKIHCSLVNRSITAKLSGTNGQVKVRFIAGTRI